MLKFLKGFAGGFVCIMFILLLLQVFGFIFVGLTAICIAGIIAVVCGAVSFVKGRIFTPSWLNGGVIFSAIFYFIPFIVSSVLFLSFSQDQLQIIYSSGFLGSVLTILTFPQLIGTMFLGQMGYVVVFALYFLVGAIIGLLVGKMKLPKNIPND